MLRTNISQPTRQQVLSWIHSLLPQFYLSLKIQDLGKGVIYCKILNHYYPGIILINRIIQQPKNQYQNILNLRIFQNALAQVKIMIPFDPIRLSKQKLSDNWAFISSLYRVLVPHQENNTQQQHKNNSLFYPSFKRTIDSLYSDQPYSNSIRMAYLPPQISSQNKNTINGNKLSVSKLYNKQNTIGSPSKGKWSVNSHMFQNNLQPIIDRIKQILLKSSHDIQKIRQIKMLLNIPLNQQPIVKIQQNDTQIIKVNTKQETIKINNKQQTKTLTNKQEIIQNNLLYN